MRRKIMALTFAVLLPFGAVSGIAQAEDTQSPEAMVRDGLDKVMAAISLFVESIPMYEPPEVLPNGDIIIRRVHPDNGEPDNQREPGTDPTDT